jgi:hypothetical protein
VAFGPRLTHQNGQHREDAADFCNKSHIYSRTWNGGFIIA